VVSHHFVEEIREAVVFNLLELARKLQNEIEKRERLIEDMRDTRAYVKKYLIHCGFCKRCNKLVEGVVTEALLKSTVGLNLLIFTAWLHHGLGVTIHHIREVLMQTRIINCTIKTSGIILECCSLLCW